MAAFTTPHTKVFKAYLSSDLVTALTSLKVNYFSHFVIQINLKIQTKTQIIKSK